MQIQLKTSKEKFNIFKETPIYMGVSVILLILLILSIGFAVTLGSVDISIKEVYKIIFNKLFVFIIACFWISNPNRNPFVIICNK